MNTACSPCLGWPTFGTLMVTQSVMHFGGLYGWTIAA